MSKKTIQYKQTVSGGGGGGNVDSVSGNIVDNTDPANPIVTQVQANMSILNDASPAYVDNVQAILDVDSSIPDENYDSSEGYRVGARIFVSSPVNSEYVCLDNTVGAAVWIPSIGYKRFVGVLSQASTDAPEIIGTPYVNDVGLVNGDFSYLSDGQYLISKTGIGIGFKNQCGVLGTFNILSAVAYYQLSRVDDDSILLNTYYNEYDSMASPPLMVISTDRLINNNLIEIRFPAL